MNIAKYFFARRAPGVKPAWIADMLKRLVWLLDENGAEIHEVPVEPTLPGIVIAM